MDEAMHNESEAQNKDLGQEESVFGENTRKELIHLEPEHFQKTDSQSMVEAFRSTMIETEAGSKEDSSLLFSSKQINKPSPTKISSSFFGTKMKSTTGGGGGGGGHSKENISPFAPLQLNNTLVAAHTQETKKKGFVQGGASKPAHHIISKNQVSPNGGSFQSIPEEEPRRGEGEGGRGNLMISEKKTFDIAEGGMDLLSRVEKLAKNPLDEASAQYLNECVVFVQTNLEKIEQTDCLKLRREFLAICYDVTLFEEQILGNKLSEETKMRNYDSLLEQAIFLSNGFLDKIKASSSLQKQRETEFFSEADIKKLLFFMETRELNQLERLFPIFQKMEQYLFAHSDMGNSSSSSSAAGSHTQKTRFEEHGKRFHKQNELVRVSHQQKAYKKFSDGKYSFFKLFKFTGSARSYAMFPMALAQGLAGKNYKTKPGDWINFLTEVEEFSSGVDFNRYCNFARLLLLYIGFHTTLIYEKRDEQPKFKELLELLKAKFEVIASKPMRAFMNFLEKGGQGTFHVLQYVSLSDDQTQRYKLQGGLKEGNKTLALELLAVLKVQLAEYLHESFVLVMEGLGIGKLAKFFSENSNHQVIEENYLWKFSAAKREQARLLKTKSGPKQLSFLHYMEEDLGKAETEIERRLNNFGVLEPKKKFRKEGLLQEYDLTSQLDHDYVDSCLKAEALLSKEKASKFISQRASLSSSGDRFSSPFSDHLDCHLSDEDVVNRQEFLEELATSIFTNHTFARQHFKTGRDLVRRQQALFFPLITQATGRNIGIQAFQNDSRQAKQAKELNLRSFSRRTGTISSEQALYTQLQEFPYCILSSRTTELRLATAEFVEESLQKDKNSLEMSDPEASLKESKNAHLFTQRNSLLASLSSEHDRYYAHEGSAQIGGGKKPKQQQQQQQTSPSTKIIRSFGDQLFSFFSSSTPLSPNPSADENNDTSIFAQLLERNTQTNKSRQLRESFWWESGLTKKNTDLTPIEEETVSHTIDLKLYIQNQEFNNLQEMAKALPQGDGVHFWERVAQAKGDLDHLEEAIKGADIGTFFGVSDIKGWLQRNKTGPIKKTCHWDWYTALRQQRKLSGETELNFFKKFFELFLEEGCSYFNDTIIELENLNAFDAFKITCQSVFFLSKEQDPALVFLCSQQLRVLAYASNLFDQKKKSLVTEILRSNK